ncbi:DMT family transporter [Actinomadura madurae]|nr:DMT family transporter [Actinomadura madurae]
MSWLFLGEVPGLITLAGGVLCLAGRGRLPQHPLSPPPRPARHSGTGRPGEIPLGAHRCSYSRVMRTSPVRP